MVRSAVRSFIGLSVAVALGACAGGDEPVPIASTAQALLNGSPSPATEDYAIRIYIRGLKGGASSCSGVLVAPTLVLTARHCITTGLIQNSNTQCVLGTERIAPELITVHVGREVSSFREYSVKRTTIEYESDKCSADIASLELSEPVTGVTIAPLELDAPPKDGDTVSSIAWGITSDTADYPSERQRADGRVLGTRSGTYTTPLGSTVYSPEGYIVTSINGCYGDSGSPAVDARGAVIGVLSDAFVEASSSAGTGAGATSCMDGLNAYIPFYRYTAFIERIFQSTGKMPVRAGRPAPAELGGTCAQDNECNSNYCVGVGPRSLCSKTCNVDTDCGGPLVCTDSGSGPRVCLDSPTPPVADDSCGVAPGVGTSRGQGLAGAVFSLSMVVALRQRRNRPKVKPCTKRPH